MAPSIGKRKSIAVVFVSLMAVVFVLAVAVAFVPGYAAEPRQKTFSSPKEAVQALVAAVKAGDTAELLAIFGRDAEDFIYSENEAKDEERRERFLAFYEERNRIETLGANRAVLHVGQDDWTMPIPVVKAGNRWRFETKEGIQEILARRIGRNELAAIQVCLAYVDAQLEYAEKRAAAAGLVEYAQRFASAAGKKDGLCWEAKEGEPLSPMGPQIADACKEDFKGRQQVAGPVPYHGYFYRILKKQGKSAPGGAYEYVVNGKMIGGFALVAYPAVHGVTGVMTFIVNHDGIVFQKDLGRDTEKIAEAMTAFDPDNAWHKVE